MAQPSLSETWESSITGKAGHNRPRLNLDSTALLDVTDDPFHAQRNLTLSPILRPRSPKYFASRDSSTLFDEETNIDCEDSQFEKAIGEANHCSPSTSTPSRTTRNGIYNPFEKHLASRLLHNTMSPSIFESLENLPPTPETPCSTSFSWSIEQMALLNPTEITDEEIANSAFSPDPALEAKYRAAADIYWNSGRLYVPSPEGPGPMLVSKTPLADVVRLRAARLAAAAGSMTKAQVETPVCKTSKKRRSSSLRSGAQVQKRHCGTQTACTISPKVDFDFAAILGEASVFHDLQVDAGEEFEANSSIGSLRRRLFAEDDDSCLSDSPNQDLTKNHLKADLDGVSDMAETPQQSPPPPQPSSNPGSYDELHRKARDVFPTCFEGAKVIVQKGLSSHFQVAHTLSLSPMNTGYKFGATYVGHKQLGPQEAFPILLGDTDVAGNTTGTFLHTFGEKWRVRLQGQVQQAKLAGAQGTIERRGTFSTIGVTLANTDLVSESGIVVAQLLRRFTKRVDLGAELVYQYGRQVPGGQITVPSYSARYAADFWTAAATFGMSGLHLSYHHRQTENIQFGVEFESNLNVQEAMTTFGYQVEMPEEGVTMRASVDTNWTVCGVFEKRLSQQLPFTLAISGMLNHAKSAGKFGIGLIIG